jgi:hypothetical protein
MKRHNTCPRCSGSLFLGRDEGRLEWVCLQCARTFRLDLQPIRRQPTAPPERETARVA